MLIDIVIVGVFFLLRVPIPNMVPSIAISGLTYRLYADLLFIILFFVLLKFKKAPISANVLGWRKVQLSYILLGILGALILLILSLTIIQVVPQNQIYNYDFTLYPIKVYILLLVTSTTEELFYRGFMIQKLISSRILGTVSVIFISSLFFSIGHAYLGIGGIIFSFLSGILLAFLLIKYQSIISVMLAHILYNIIFYTIYIFDSSI